jgi:hypothetical protein
VTLINSGPKEIPIKTVVSMSVCTEPVYHKNLLLCGHSTMIVTKLNSINFTLLTSLTSSLSSFSFPLCLSSVLLPFIKFLCFARILIPFFLPSILVSLHLSELVLNYLYVYRPYIFIYLWISHSYQTDNPNVLTWTVNIRKRSSASKIVHYNITCATVVRLGSGV